MKNIYAISIWMLVAMAAKAQVPQKISYQAVLRNQSNAILSLKQIGVKISILQGDSLGLPVYVENHVAKDRKSVV